MSIWSIQFEKGESAFVLSSVRLDSELAFECIVSNDTGEDTSDASTEDEVEFEGEDARLG
jgi:hypothetical protein